MRRAAALAALALGLLPSCTCGPSCCPSPCGPVATLERPAPVAPPFATGGETSAWAYLRRKYDADGDGAVSAREYRRGARAFANLDATGDGALTAADFRRTTRMERMIAQLTVATFFQADENADELSLAEMETAFASLDTDGDGRLSMAELTVAIEAGRASAGMPAGVDPLPALRAVVDTDEDGALSRAEMRAHFAARDEDGDGLWKRSPAAARAPASSGPEVGSLAPDFTLEPPGGGAPVTLSAFRGRKPVALIFGSYT